MEEGRWSVFWDSTFLMIYSKKWSISPARGRWGKPGWPSGSRARTGSPVSYVSIAEDVQIAPNTVKKYIQIIEVWQAEAILEGMLA